MTASQHTPGPWELHSSTEGDPRMGDGSYCISGPIGDQRGILARIVPPDWHETPANARLIASAPELLQALENLVASIENVDFSSHAGVYDQIPWAQAEAAVAKAKGGE